MEKKKDRTATKYLILGGVGKQPYSVVIYNLI